MEFISLIRLSLRSNKKYIYYCRWLLKSNFY